MFGKPGVYLLALLVSGCAAGKHSTQTSSNKNRHNMITAYEIADSHHTGAASAYDVIRTLRPHFLYARGCQATNSQIMESPAVYLNGIHLSGEDRLQEIQASSIEEIRYLSSMESKVLYAGVNNCGVISIRTKSQ